MPYKNPKESRLKNLEMIRARERARYHRYKLDPEWRKKQTIRTDKYRREHLAERREYWRKWREKNRERARKYSREGSRRRRAENITPFCHLVKEWQERNPEKYWAHKCLRMGIKMGLIVRQPCSICGNEESHAHHSDYCRPLFVQWLCPLHHKEIHNSEKGGVS